MMVASITSAFGRQKKESEVQGHCQLSSEYKASLGYIETLSQKQQNKIIIMVKEMQLSKCLDSFEGTAVI